MEGYVITLQSPPEVTMLRSDVILSERLVFFAICQDLPLLVAKLWRIFQVCLTLSSLRQ